MTPEKRDQIRDLVAEHVMGWKQHPTMPDCWEVKPEDGYSTTYMQKHYWNPVTDGNDMLDVWTKMKGRYPQINTDGDHSVCIMHASDDPDDRNGVESGSYIATFRRNVSATADTPQLAVCLCALRAMGVEVPE